MTAEEAPQKHRSYRLLLAVLALLLAVLYAQMLLSYSGGRWVPPLRDDLIFFQYARSIAENHPFEFYPGAIPTTGATSHLYVFALVPVYLTMKGTANLFAGAFLLNGAFWLVSVMLVYGIARRLFERTAEAATLLVILTGPISFGFFAGHDMALATMLFLFAAWGLAANQAIVAAVALFLLGWARPEGLLVSAALIAVALIAPKGKRRPRWAVAGLIGILGTAGVLVFNRLLTGDVVFTSMQNKGLLGRYPLHVSLCEAAGAAATLVRDIFIGDGQSGRAFYFLPLIGIPFLLGLIPRLKWATVDLWMAVSAILVTGLVAISGYVGLQHDKYLVWVFVLVAMYAVAGLPALENLFGGRIRWQVLFAIVAVFGVVGTVWFLGDYGRRIVEERAVAGTIERAGALLPENARVGVMGGSGIQYYLPQNEVINLNGITHAGFVAAWSNPAAQFEVLEHNPPLRPAFWFLSDPERGQLDAAGLLGAPILSSPAFLGAQTHEAMYLATTEWLNEAPETPIDAAVLQITGTLKLVDAIDLTFPEDEAAHNYQRFMRARGMCLLGNVTRGPLEGRTIVEGGYGIFGDEQFEVSARPQMDLWMVVRTSRQFQEISLLGPRHREQFDFALTPPLSISLYVDGRQVPLQPQDLSPVGVGFDERLFRIPAEFIGAERVTLRIAGDHIAYHYWFYQDL